jgi:hypothetical protein
MSITGWRYGHLWAQHFDGGFSYSKTVQVPGVTAICEIALTSHWGEDDFHTSYAHITQIVSADGVEEFQQDDRTSSNLTSMVSRDRVTSVTFRVRAFYGRTVARWVVWYWQ